MTLPSNALIHTTIILLYCTRERETYKRDKGVRGDKEVKGDRGDKGDRGNKGVRGDK